MKKVIPLVIALLFYGCDADSIKQRVNDGIKDADAQLEQNYKDSKKDFLAAYPKALASAGDSSLKNKINNYHNNVLSSLAFADSLKVVLNQMDSSDPNTYKDVRKVFVGDNAGNDLFKKLRSSYQLTKSLALTPERKDEIEISYKNAFNGFEYEQAKQVFELNNPRGMQWMLCGFEQELLTLGAHVLQDYK